MAGLLTRVFGIGRVPGRDRAAYTLEGIELQEEGMSGSVTYRRYRAPFQRYYWRRRWFLGSVVLTGRRFVAYAYGSRVVDLEWDDPRLAALHCWAESPRSLAMRFEASAFHADQSGTIDYRSTTPLAEEIVRRLRAHGASGVE